jgi:hypothetical protein
MLIDTPCTAAHRLRQRGGGIKTTSWLESDFTDNPVKLAGIELQPGF